jgi:hypothetical protein
MLIILLGCGQLNNNSCIRSLWFVGMKTARFCQEASAKTEAQEQGSHLGRHKNSALIVSKCVEKRT